MYRQPRRVKKRTQYVWAALAGIVLLVVAGVLVSSGGTKRKPRQFEAVGYKQLPVYHSPQTPGLTEFVGATTLPDGSLLTSFVQATGPKTRPRAPANLQRFLAADGWPPDPSAPGQIDPKWDFWGLRLSSVFLRSTDGGANWERWRTDGYKAVYPHPYSGQTLIALADGSVLRDVNGFDLLNDTSVPHTAFLQRLAPGAKSWSAPQVLLDPSRFVYQLSRIRQLDDGRLVGVGTYSQYPAPTNAQIAAGTYDPKRLQAAPRGFLLMTSSDHGRTWRRALTVSPDVHAAPDEWDVAELPNGNLLAVLRSPDPAAPTTNVRYQAVLKKDGDGWKMSKLTRAPFPSSGHPDLLAVRGGPVLYVSTDGVWYTDDEGSTWSRLPGAAATNYYPRSVEGADGTVYVLSHGGGDYWYGEGDESIQLQKFRVVQVRKRTPQG
jgi:hypothetical protein